MTAQRPRFNATELTNDKPGPLAEISQQAGKLQPAFTLLLLVECVKGERNGRKSIKHKATGTGWFGELATCPDSNSHCKGEFSAREACSGAGRSVAVGVSSAGASESPESSTPFVQRQCSDSVTLKVGVSDRPAGQPETWGARQYCEPSETPCCWSEAQTC